MSQNVREIANFIWSVADEFLRDNYKRSKYADVVYPFTVVRRLDCVLESSHEKVQEVYRKYESNLKDLSGVLCKATGFGFYNTSKYTFKKLLDNPDNIKENFLAYLNGYSITSRKFSRSLNSETSCKTFTKRGFFTRW